jgi:hypothetical protein
MAVMFQMQVEMRIMGPVAQADYRQVKMQLT